ncbi:MULTISPECIES: hypothetical protein [Agromyces]|uniref:Uncharacterized protein n=1 Tax=Agromyces kandeliae TaxID=2666141 RepID=A0A6L5R3C5_9MICO|nr:hypothetical protein [Agromyces kandeliae]MRX44523.1 hypothetical protein [Agromyces kandeliae]
MTDTETSATASEDRERRRPATTLAGLAAAFARARRADVPAYAPRAFDAAMAAWRSATAATEADRATRIDEAVAALGTASERACCSADLLGDVRRRRVGAMYHDRDRSRVTVVLDEAGA